MKKLNIIYLAISFMFYASTYVDAQENKVMTYNIRYDNPNDGINKWDNRKAEVADLILHYNPDFLGIQEGKLHQLQYLDSRLTGYSRIGVGRDDGKKKGEFSAIYYNDDKVTLVDGSTFWLSPTPDEVSVGWDASMERICTYGLFENKLTREKTLVFNTHYDHIGQNARIKSSELILEKIEEINKDQSPVILMGDFNAEMDNEAIKTIVKKVDDAAQLAETGIYGPVGTFTGFKKEEIPLRRIDYIFVKGISNVNRYVHIDDRMKNSNYLSDHLPVMIDFILN